MYMHMINRLSLSFRCTKQNHSTVMDTEDSIWWTAKMRHLLSDLNSYKGIRWSQNSLREDGMKLVHYSKHLKAGWVPGCVFLQKNVMLTLIELTWCCVVSYYPHSAQDSECFLNWSSQHLTECHVSWETPRTLLHLLFPWVCLPKNKITNR